MHRTSISLSVALRWKADRETRALGISLDELMRRRLGESQAKESVGRRRFFSRDPRQNPGPDDSATNHDDHLHCHGNLFVDR